MARPRRGRARFLTIPTYENTRMDSDNIWVTSRSRARSTTVKPPTVFAYVVYNVTRGRATQYHVVGTGNKGRERRGERGVTVCRL